MDLSKTMYVAASGLKAQGERLRVIAENLANADSTAVTAGGKPYQRKTVVFSNVLDDATGAQLVKVAGETEDPTPFARRFDPGHPAADADGYVLLPNVNPLIEMADMRQALRAYEANLRVVEASKMMVQRTIDLLRG
jgi:flagellar basal-body rod protein FlgC